MSKILSCLLSLAISVPAFGQAGPGFASQDCGEIGENFEAISDEFTRNWSGEPDFCEFKRFTALNEMIADDMLVSPERYNQRMIHIQNLKSKNPEAVNYLLLSFQESWFNANIDSVLLKEKGRSGTWSRWLTYGAAGTAVALLALPMTKKYSSKTLRLFKTGLKHFLQKRVLTFAPTSVASQLDKLTSDGGKKKPVAFVAPPLFFGGDDDVLDERTYGVFLKEIQEDVISATGGILGGWFLGHGASVVVRDRVAKSWTETAAGRFAWSRTKPAVFASPGMIAGFAVTFAATKGISDFASELQFQKRFTEIRDKMNGDLRALAGAVGNRQEFRIYSLSEKLKNDLTLHNFILTHDLANQLGGEAESAAQSLINSFQYCVEPREVTIARAKVRFFKDIAGTIKEYSRNVKAALVLAQNAQETILSHPHSMTKVLAGANDKLMMRTAWMLDAQTTAADLWEDIVLSVKDKPVECIDMTVGMPL